MKHNCHIACSKKAIFPCRLKVSDKRKWTSTKSEVGRVQNDGSTFSVQGSKKTLATDVPYLGSEAADLHDALDGEEDGEDEIAVGQEVGVVQGGAVVLKWNGDRTVKVVTKTAYK